MSGLKDTETGQIIREPSVLPNLLNKYFVSIGHNLKVIFLIICTPMTWSEIESEILSIPNKKAYGLCLCPTKILNCLSNVISEPFSENMNMSIKMKFILPF